MDRSIIAQLKAEEADLERKLKAVRQVLAVYGAAPATPAGASSSSPPTPSPTRAATGKRERVGLDRFSEYGRAVVEAAIQVILHDGSGRPIPTRELLESIQQRGIEVRGEDKTNALSALLARSVDVRPNGRRGWTLAGEQNGHKPEENEPPTETPLDGSETDGEDAPTSNPSMFNP